MKYFLLLLLSFICFNLKAQDTTKYKPLTYIQVYQSMTNTPGTFAGRSNLSLEVGKQWDVFSLGIDIGKTTLEKQHGRDTSTYFEIRPNLNVFQQGRFTNTLTTGVGYVFGAKENFLTELTSGIEYSMSDRVHLNVSFGQYYYSGRYSSSSVTFFGTSVSYYFAPYKNRGSIIKNNQ